MLHAGPMQQHNVVIIGAGPGGGATALRLAQNGVRDVVLIDKDPFPRDKTCGSGLSPNALKLLAELGLDTEARKHGYLCHSLKVVTPGNRVMELHTEEAAVVLLRKFFDNMLVDRARSLGVDFRGEHKATELIKEGSRVVGVRGRKKSGEPFEIRARYVLAADGAHSIFSSDPRPKKTISCLMGWWEDFDFEPGTMEMIFDKNIAPLYGWMFPEGPGRVNIGICMDGEDADGNKTQRNVREVFQKFLDDHFADRLKTARQIGKWKGHPISYTTWISNCTHEGMLYLGEGARITHNATGEGIYQAMQSGVYAADAVKAVLGGADEQKEWERYLWQNRKKFTASFLVGHALRGLIRSPVLDWVAMAYNSPAVRKAATLTVGSMMAGSTLTSKQVRTTPMPTSPDGGAPATTSWTPRTPGDSPRSQMN